MITLPTLTELQAQYKTDIESKFSTTLPAAGKSFLRGFAGVLAGVSYTLWLALGKVQKNQFADICDYETLIRFGRVKLGRNPFPATAGQYLCNVTGTAGAVVTASTTFKSDDDSSNPGFLFILDSDYTMTGTSDQITLRALTAGLGSQLEIANTLTLTAPIALVDSSAAVSSVAVTPLSSEIENDYRGKVLDAFRLEPQGGAGSDYRLWAADVQEVKQSYPYSTMGSTAVDLYIEATIADSVDGKGTPSGVTIGDVTTAIASPTVARPSRKPISDDVNYLQVTPLNVDITIADFIGITAANTDLITAAILAELSSVRPFISSIDVLSAKNDFYDTNKIISTVLEILPGSSFGDVTLIVNAVTVTTFTFTGGNIPYFNSLTIT